VEKHERTLSVDLEDKIISLYAVGTSNRDITKILKDAYGVEVSAEFISRATDKILPLVREWQNRPLESVYPIIYLDGVVFPVKQEGTCVKKTVYLVMGIDLSGQKDVQACMPQQRHLGIWVGESESAKFWLKVLSDLKNRGVKDVLIACVDGLKGFKEAIAAVYPQTDVQKCIVHQIRNSTKYVNYKDLKEFCADMCRYSGMQACKQIYTAPNEEAGLVALERFGDIWSKKYGYAVKSWKENWPELSTFFKYPPEIRRIIYTTNVQACMPQQRQIENLNRQVRKATKNKSSFPTDDSLTKIIYLAVTNVVEKWANTSIRDWSAIINQLRIYYGDRIDNYM
jgi:transposase-like protein